MTVGVFTLNILPYQVPNNSIFPVRVHGYSCTDTYSTITALAYLNVSVSAKTVSEINNGDFILVTYSGGQAIFNASISAGIITLIPLVTRIEPVNDLTNDMTGFQLSWNSGSPATVTVQPGSCFDSTGTALLTTTQSATIGIPNLDTGSWTAARWYFIFVGQNGTNTLYKLSLSHTSPVFPSGYLFRCIGCLRSQSTGGNTLLTFIQSGNGNQKTYYWFTGDSTIQVLSNGSAVIGAPGTFSCAGAQSPLSNLVSFSYNFVPGSGKAGDTLNITPTAFPTSSYTTITGPVAAQQAIGTTGYYPTDSTQHMSYYVGDATDTASLNVVSYIENL